MPRLGEYSPNASARSIYQRKFNAKPEQKKRRAQRNGARAAAIRMHGKSKLKGKDVDHVEGNTKGNLNNNKTRLLSIGENRSKGAKASHRNR